MDHAIAMRHPDHDRLVQVVPTLYTTPALEMGYQVERRSFGFFGSVVQLFSLPIPTTRRFTCTAGSGSSTKCTGGRCTDLWSEQIKRLTRTHGRL